MVAAAAKNRVLVITQPKRVDEQDQRDEQRDEHADGAPVSRHVRVDVLTRVGLTDRSTGNGDSEDDRQHDQNHPDDHRKQLRPNGIYLGEGRLERHRVIDQECADENEDDAHQVLRVVDGSGGHVVLWLLCGGHSSPKSVSVDETR